MPLYPQGGGLYPDSIDNTLLVDMPDGTIKGRALGVGAGNPQDLTAVQVAEIIGSTYVWKDVRLDFVSSTVLRLSRHNGFLLTIDNIPRMVPAAGVDLAPTGLSVGLYYIYAAWVAGVMVLEATATSTPHVVDPRNGMRVKSGDASRTLVGMAHPATGPIWSVTADGSRLVSSYYNRRQFRIHQGVNLSTGTSGSYVNISGGGSFLSWAGDVAEFLSYVYYLNAANSVAYNQATLDVGSIAILESAWANSYCNLQLAGCYAYPTDAYRTCIAQGYQSVGGGAWVGSFQTIIWA